MVNIIGNVILETLKPKGRKAWELFVKILSSVKSGISFDINSTPTWTMSVGEIESPSTTLKEIFTYLQHADKPCLVAIDEFQQIIKYTDNTIEADLRTHIQYCSNARFVFFRLTTEPDGTAFHISVPPLLSKRSLLYVKYPAN